ncbi:hypothetical protein PSE_5005 [Pseudovibrio sp. FO-BEG1]|nr:hypothetical protein PSE_5005 [Pseudovibrio sp. FO-BEG1]
MWAGEFSLGPDALMSSFLQALTLVARFLWDAEPSYWDAL